MPKPHRVTDKALLKALRISYCELCGRADMECGVHHIFLRRSPADQACRLMGGLKFPRFGGGGQRPAVSSVAASLSLCRHGGKSHGGVVTSE